MAGRCLAAEPGVDDIGFAGAGEPTMHPRFRDAVSYHAEAHGHNAKELHEKLAKSEIPEPRK